MTFLRKNIPLKDYSYYKTGGVCYKFYSPSCIEGLQQALREIREENLPYFLLGLGSNSLITDEPWKGAVISFAKLNRIILKDHTLTCGAGVENSTIAKTALKHSLAGCSWMYGLPGQIGGTVRMNARCYGGEINQIVTKVVSITPTGKVVCYSDHDLKTFGFRGYKNTIFMNNNELIVSCNLSLKKGCTNNILQHMNSCKNDRITKGQYLHPSSGCIFKNDYHPKVSLPAGLMLDNVGVRGLNKGQATVSTKHANFIFNTSDASSQDILELSLLMREKVWEELGVWLEYELEILGSLSEPLLKRIREKRSYNLNTTKLSNLQKMFRKR